MRWQVTIHESTAVPGWVARVHPKGVHDRFWVYAIHDQDKATAIRKALSWCATRDPETVLANLQRRREAAYAG